MMLTIRLSNWNCQPKTTEESNLKAIAYEAFIYAYPMLEQVKTVNGMLKFNNLKPNEFKATVYGAYIGHETFDIGRNEGLPVNEEYADMGKFIFIPGQLHKVVFDIKNPDEQDVSAAEYSIIE